MAHEFLKQDLPAVEKPAVFRRFPELNDIPWFPLGQFPTPVERLENLGTELGMANLWVKRDDVSGRLYGGNKVRTLEFCLADAQQKQTELLVAYSALGSSWPLACAIYGRLMGWSVDIFYLPYPTDEIKKKNLHVTKKLARRVTTAHSLFTFPFCLYFHLRRARKKHKVYLTPPGGVTPVTTLSYVNAVLELQQQVERGEAPVPDFIFCPLGSGGTAAGIAIGLNLIDWPTQVVAVRVVDFLVANKMTLKNLIRRAVNTMKNKGVRLSTKKKWGDNVQIEHGYFGKGYGRPTVMGAESIRLMQKFENRALDSTYSGKAFAAVLDLCKKNSFENKKVLFWQTLNSRNLDTIPEKLAEL
ncbi:MAG: 1-aminocyclopropane-1-carboxylate deaminase/D-cysteine desulfhydrase [bacterium]